MFSLAHPSPSLPLLSSSSKATSSLCSGLLYHAFPICSSSSITLPHNLQRKREREKNNIPRWGRLSLPLPLPLLSSRNLRRSHRSRYILELGKRGGKRGRKCVMLFYLSTRPSVPPPSFLSRVWRRNGADFSTRRQ